MRGTYRILQFVVSYLKRKKVKIYATLVAITKKRLTYIQREDTHCILCRKYTLKDGDCEDRILQKLNKRHLDQCRDKAKKRKDKIFWHHCYPQANTDAKLFVGFFVTENIFKIHVLIWCIWGQILWQPNAPIILPQFCSSTAKLYRHLISLK